MDDRNPHDAPDLDDRVAPDHRLCAKMEINMYLETEMKRLFRRVLAGCGLWFGICAFAVANDEAALHLDVYKSPTCGCCTEWMDHLAGQGIATSGHHPDSLGALKREWGIPVRYGSCHTGVSKAGFVFEGHVPARYITQFLKNPPLNALGLSVPAMPLGSPGMEYNNQFTPYEILLLKKDGTVEVYAAVDSYAQQFH